MTQSKPSKAIITAAVTGAIHTPTMSPHLPVTPEQLIDDIMSVYEAGGAVAHLHVRDPETGQPKADQAIFREVVTEVIRGDRSFDLDVGTTISVLAARPATGVTLDGFRWPLHGVSLEPGSTLGVSNVVTASPCRVAAGSGTLLLIIPHDAGPDHP